MLLPVVAHNIFIREPLPAVASLLLLGLLMVNILLLSLDRRAFLTPPVTLLMTLGLILVSLYLGQNYSLYLVFPLVVALPVLLHVRWAVYLGVLTGLLVAPVVFTGYDAATGVVIGVSLGLTWIVSAWLVFAVNEQSRRLRGMAITDPLTGVYNRRYLELQATRSLQYWQRYRRPSSLLLLDIDHFKRINDRFGHSKGDEALKGVVRVIEQRVRRSDLVCRFGGEEFVVLLSECTGENALAVAENLRRTIEETRILPEGGVTVSVGVCEALYAESTEHWFKLADAALYIAKGNGRNRVEAARVEIQPADAIPATVPHWR